MKLATAHFPSSKQSKTTIGLCYALAAIIILMVVAQLMTIEKTLPIIDNYLLPGGTPTAKIVLFFSAVSGVFALPFLFRMSLSPLFRIFSAFLLNIFACIWIFLGIWIVVSDPPLIGTGLFGSLLKPIPGGVVLPFACLLLADTLLVTYLLKSDLKFKR